MVGVECLQEIECRRCSSGAASAGVQAAAAGCGTGSEDTYGCGEQTEVDTTTTQPHTCKLLTSPSAAGAAAEASAISTSLDSSLLMVLVSCRLADAS